MPTVDRIDLDHVALAAERAFDNLVRYRGELGGEWRGGGVDPGFWWGQVRFANGMDVELLEPVNVHLNDFLRRFLDRNGPGPHHVTFKVPDIEEALGAARAAGYQPVGENLHGPGWKEAFLHPKQSHGIVVQLAQPREEGEEPFLPDNLPAARSAAPALARLVHLVADLDAAGALFEKVLSGDRIDEGGDGDGAWVDLAWPGPGRLRLLRPTAPAPSAWLGGRAGRLHHLDFRCPEPAVVAGARPIGGGWYEVRPEDNLGVRLRLASAGAGGYREA